ncbi:MAG: tRNA uridine-5-carboxymethylaminomethyl(34) synthesis GTPase MnmE [Desulfatibacillaceae bacterium]|nr:tRNA uridine-5-carboxymethylaminomethyl(34) synthesis GTPase MnmE [Desulfatibacillaceae bacterium]
MFSDIDTIAAPATGPGPGAIGIIRISGPLSMSIASQIFKPFKPGVQIKPRKLIYGQIVEPGSGIVRDEVLLAFMPGPNSFTGEDVVEISAHGSRAAIGAILDLVFSLGARPAQPGEFTRRAFLSGRMDLAQAEAVADLIDASSSRAADMALSQMQGSLSRKVGQIREIVLSWLVRISAALDFGDDTGEFDEEAFFQSLSQQALPALDALLDASKSGQILREGIRVVLAGRPNVGKSSLLNAFLGKPRALVTPVSGTTRDCIEEKALVQGYGLVFTDTAGLGPSQDAVELLGMEKTREAINQCHLVLLVIDLAQGVLAEDEELFHQLKSKPLLVAANKSDLLGPDQDPKQPPQSMGKAPWIRVSALTGDNLDKLARSILSLVNEANALELSVAPNIRHRAALSRARNNLLSILTAKGGLPIELAAIEIQDAVNALGEITGQTADPDILDEVFSRFCIGK